jgi:hypothetical protein
MIMFVSVADFLLHGEEYRKFGRHFINLGERTFKIKRLVIFHMFFTLTLDNHVVHGHKIVHVLPHLRLRPSKSLTLANR